MSDTPLNLLLNATESFQATYGDAFVTVGIGIYNGLALILVAWVGLQIALSGHFDAAKFTKFIMMLAFGKALTTYYSSPIPGVGYSLVDLIVEQGRFLSSHLDSRAVDDFSSVAAELLTNTKAPRWISSPVETILFFLQIIVWGMLALAAWFVIAYGQIALAVCVMLGPCFVPFFLVPKLDFLFWGWLKATIQYSFYRVVASAVCWIVAKAVVMPLANIMAEGNPSDPTTLGRTLMALFFGVIAILSVLKVPAITASIFSGSASGGDGGVVSAGTAAARTATAGIG